MQAKDYAAEFFQRANKVRKIARGIFDKTERRIVLKFVRDGEKMAAKTVTPMQTILKAPQKTL
jgi:hypothetical protein